MIHATDFSKFEHCPIEVRHSRLIEPERFTLREGMKRYFERGVFTIMTGGDHETVTEDFITHCSSRGFEYPEEAEPYVIAKDAEAWLDGAFRIVEETADGKEPIAVVKVGENNVYVDGFSDESGVAWLYRISSELGDQKLEKLHWPEMILLAYTDAPEVRVISFRLPGIRHKRIQSPLNLGFKHPLTGQIRLARVDQENQQGFASKWKRIGRWEDPTFLWEEWRAGIDKDQCMNLVAKEWKWEPLDSETRREIRLDAEHMIYSMDQPTVWPRKRESCGNCMFLGWCHGNSDDRQLFIPIGDLNGKESAQGLTQAQSR